ncbi:uncharacterized protein EV422DRAFT_547031 [Fimicolochytrium jonesii]|uniref:uncharacterized protein n=1 Tax=Fimicolochytrium jonesii TaxID=1396493 RepID=UPI0022FE3D8B|nr:uncharacterized protein EV422DRAFT_547031 [Fimicolochytrium jonesii]KAI8816175.1 hypothetical protein EV422DRAFT_547031 [Fimicolochytrium jonesii]
MSSSTNPPAPSGATDAKRTTLKIVPYPRDPKLTYNVMKIPDPKFHLASMVPPLRMVRDKPEPRRRFAKLGDANGAATGTSTPLGGGGGGTPSGSGASEGIEKPKPDSTTIAPFGNAIKTRTKRFQKKTKIYTLSRDPNEDDDPDARAERRRYKRDPDKFPYLFSDFEGSVQYQGDVQGASEAVYMVMIKKGDRLQAVPVNKWYKFTPKPKYRTLTSEEANEIIKQQRGRRLDTWYMHKQAKEEEKNAESAEPKVKEEKGYMKKLLGTEEKQTRDRSDRQDLDAAELDYEEEFADDEDIRFGMEDEEDEKEARNRQYGKHGKRTGFLSDDDDEDEVMEEKKSRTEAAVGKRLKKVLKKVDAADDIKFSDEENPYISEVEDSDSEEEEPNPDDPAIKTEPNLLKRKDSDTLTGPTTKRIKAETALAGGVSPALSSPEYRATKMGTKRPKASTSPAHLGNAGRGSKANSPNHLTGVGRASSPLGRAGSTSPLSDTARVGKKRKGAASSDDDAGDKRQRTDTGPVKSNSAADILKHISGSRSSSPLHPGTGLPPSARSKAAAAGRPKGSGSKRGTPAGEAAASGKAATSPATASASAGRATPAGGTGGGSSSKRKAPASSTGMKKNAAGAGSTRKTPVAGSATSPKPAAAAAAAKSSGTTKSTATSSITTTSVLQIFRTLRRETMEVSTLISEIQKAAPGLPLPELKKGLGPALKELTYMKKDEGASTAGGRTVTLREGLKDW